MKIHRQTASLRHQVQEVLREEIIAGRLKPGERLVEQQLCDSLEVSRTSLREALRHLEAEGLVELIPYRGAAVASVALEDARQIYEVRGVLEAQAVRNFVRHASDAELNALRVVLEEFEQRAVPGISGADLLDIKQRFYHVLFDIEQNTVVRGLLEMLNNRVSLLRALSMGREGRLRHTLIELRAMVDAIVQRNEIEACAATVAHINKAADNVLALLHQQEAMLDNNS